MKSPGFTVVAVLTLALGVGANTAVFSLINAVLLRPLPYPQPDRLVLVWESAPFFGLRDSPVAPGNFADWKARSKSFEDIGAMEWHAYRLTVDGMPEIAVGSLLTPGVLRALRVHPMLGRNFHDDEDTPGAAKVAIISEAFWRRRFRADPGVVGSSIPLNGQKHTIVGVLSSGSEPPGQFGGKVGDVWTTFGSDYTPARLAERGRHNWMVVGRLRAGVTLEQADAEMRTIGRQLAAEYPDTNKEVGAFVDPLRNHFVSSRRRVLTILFGAVGVVLLIACSNLANLLLCRAADRSKEAMVRAALGATRWHLVRQSLCESLLLSAAGTALGIYLATGTFRFLAHLAPGDIASLNALELDWRVLLFALAIAVLTTFAFGLMPMIQLRRADMIQSLKQSGRSLAAASGSGRLRALLISSEVGLAFVLLIVAGLLIQTFTRLRAVDVGWRTQNILTLQIPSMDLRRGIEKSAAFQRDVLAQVHAIPGVVSAGFTNHIPLVVKGDINGIRADADEHARKFQCNNRMAGPGYLRTMGIPLIRGRDIEEGDSAGSPLVVLVNQTMANMLWPGQDPIGRPIYFSTKISAQVIGVVGDIHQSGLHVPPRPEYYISSLQAPFPPSALAIHTSLEPESIAVKARQAIRSVDPEQPVAQVATMQEILDKEVLQRRLQTTLLGVFAGLALLLAGIGLYGLQAYVVAQQTSEIGLRIALGADPLSAFRRVVGRALRLTILGLAGGAVAALAVTRLLTSVLFGIAPTDPLTYVVVAVVLLLCAAAASYLPARRASRVDPIVALRQE
jgi:putative ABC transport system permease protein